MQDNQLTSDDVSVLTALVKLVLEHPDLADELASATGETDIATDPTVLALQVAHSAVINPQHFDATIQAYDSAEYNNFLGAVGAAMGALGSKVGSMFKGGKGDGAKGFFGRVFGGIKDKVQTWKQNRQTKKDLKNSGDPDWRETWKNTKGGASDTTLDGGIDLGQGSDGGDGGGTRGGTGIDVGTKVTPDIAKKINDGMELLEKQGRQLKIFKIATISLSIGLVGALIWAFTK